MSKLSLIKVTLSTGKVVYLRKMKISDTEMAAQQVARKASGDSTLLQIYMQKALAQLLLVKIEENGVPRDLKPIEKEDMDSLFEMGEYTQMLSVIGELAGGDTSGKKPQMEMMVSD